jgi:hypothetical protein
VLQRYATTASALLSGKPAAPGRTIGYML